jgi:hypothetical protein
MNANKNEQPNGERDSRLREMEKNRSFAAGEVVLEMPSLFTRSSQTEGGAVVQLLADDKTDSRPFVFIRS